MLLFRREWGCLALTAGGARGVPGTTFGLEFAMLNVRMSLLNDGFIVTELPALWSPLYMLLRG